jgi:hypothetical protein
MNKKQAIDNLRSKTLQKVINFFANEGEDIQQTKTGTAMFPAVDELGNECFLTVTVQIPKGSRDGEAYDGYAEAENYRIETKRKQEEKLAKEIAKQKKIERDKKLREEKAKLKKEKETE